ncbi:ABC transporter ATP-binding protein [Candidatus Paracaedibacter symbiosus]|uniref:ABC transporter ATP-binding protein n=1 Tax=Candidatus Paracaedibacter symbiosus TaxID=244582 RepID=UPI0005094099|nr:ATP-binding cassette domain-containing protein [Candidatus Paracaedibacter symbiosus]
MIHLDNIHVTFAPGQVTEKKAIRGISINIKEGDFITVVGSNGAGKSTFLNTIAGEVAALRGTISIDGQDVTKQKTHERARLVARVFQDPLAGTCADLTIAENMALAELRGKSRTWIPAISKQSRELYATLLERLGLGLENRLDTPMFLLSGGQRQAVSLLMTSLSPLKILLLDEHTSALDPKTAAFVMALTEEIIAEKNLTALMVTHSLHQAIYSGNRMIVLHEGRVIDDIDGTEKKNLSINQLLAKFGQTVDDDRLLLE